MKAIFAYIGVVALAALVAIPYVETYLDIVYTRGFVAGKQSVPDYRSQCVSFWFDEDPALAAKKLRAACVALKPKP